MDWSKPTSQLIGVFSKWEEKHTNLFKECIEKTGQVAIMLKMTKHDLENPYDYNDRIMQIAEILTQEGFIAQEDYTILTVPNIEYIEVYNE